MADKPLEDLIPSNDPRIFDFVRLWRQARGGALVPNKRDMDPAAMPGLLGMVWLYRFDDRIGDFVCRLAGEDINAAWGRSIKGLRLRDIVGEPGHPAILARWRKVIDVPLIEYGSVVEHPAILISHHTERLLLPVCTDSTTLDTVFGISLYHVSPLERDSTPPPPSTIIPIPCTEF